ncbi:MAG: hypothetical protein LLG00_06370 [Planctomycetaceae bacterium]|nr:hypothetical protein [Planctomycetaceae bacterium]
MNRGSAKILTAIAAMSVCGLLLGVATPALAVSAGPGTAGDLFHNYYAPPAGYPGVGAKLYPCPRPTPPVVGHTYVTYQPLMPHEFLYPHHRVYKTTHPDASRTRTSVHWQGRGTWLPTLLPPKYTLTRPAWGYDVLNNR